jgi:hypothetical protein
MILECFTLINYTRVLSCVKVCNQSRHCCYLVCVSCESNTFFISIGPYVIIQIDIYLMVMLLKENYSDGVKLYLPR